MSYSNLAETILDYAMTEAKRTQSTKVSPVHLLAGIRNWNSRKFDEIFPDSSEKIMNALAGITSDSSRPSGPDDEVEKLLNQIGNPADAWHVVETLLTLDAVANAKQVEVQELVIENATHDNTEASSPPEVQLSKISIDVEMCKRIAIVLQLQNSEIE